MAWEEVKEGTVPFTGQRYDLTSPGVMVAVIMVLSIGFALFNMGQALGDRLANAVLNFVGQFLPGGNPATASSENNGPAFGGE